MYSEALNCFLHLIKLMLIFFCIPYSVSFCAGEVAPSRVLPLQRRVLGDGFGIGVGLTHERMISRSSRVWKPSAPQVNLSLAQNLSGIWLGRIQAYWSDWQAAEPNPTEANTFAVRSVSPLGVDSLLSARLVPLLGLPPLEIKGTIVPFVTFGFGAFMQTRERMPPFRKVPKTSVETTAYFGLGSSYELSKVVAVEARFAYRKSIKTSQFLWNEIHLGVLVGENHVY